MKPSLIIGANKCIIDKNSSFKLNIRPKILKVKAENIGKSLYITRLFFIIIFVNISPSYLGYSLIITL